MPEFNVSNILSAVYYTLAIVAAVYAVHRILTRQTRIELETIATGFAKVIEKAVIKEARHESHERRLSVLEEALKNHDAQHRELKEELHGGLGRVNKRLDDILQIMIDHRKP
jgi:primosomal protein N''